MVIFSRAKVLFVTASICVALWALYPRDFFHALTLEDPASLQQSLKYYQKYLEKEPFEKTAHLRIAKIYERLGEPESATPHYQILFERRIRDLDIARDYFHHLLALQRMVEADAVAAKILQRFGMSRLLSAQEREDFYLFRYDFALWQGDGVRAEAILTDMMRAGMLSKDWQNEKIRLLKAQGKQDEVIHLYQQAIQKNPNNKRARADLISLLVLAKRFSQVEKVLQESLRLAPQHLEFLEIAYSYYQSRRVPQTAYVYLQKILKHSQSLAEKKRIFLQDEVFLLQELKRDKDALQKADALLKKYPNNFEVLKIHAFLNLSLHRPHVFLQDSQIMRKRFPELSSEIEKQAYAVQLYQLKNLRSSSDLFEFLAHRAERQFVQDVVYTFVNRQEQKNTVRLLELYAARFGEDDFWLEATLAHFEKADDTEKVYRLLEAWMKRHPRDQKKVERWIRLALAHKDFTRAAEVLRPWLKSSTKYFYWGEQFLFAGDRKYSEEFFQKAKNIDPESAWPDFGLFEVHRMNGDIKKARRYADNFLKKISVKTPSRRQRRMELLVRSFLHPDEELAQKYAAFIAKNPEDDQALLDAISLDLDLGRPERAQKKIISWHQRFPRREFETLALRLRLAIQRQRYAEAKQLIVQGEKKSPENPEWAWLRMEVDYLQGNYKSTARQIRHLLLKPDLRKEQRVVAREWFKTVASEVFLNFDWFTQSGQDSLGQTVGLRWLMAEKIFLKLGMKAFEVLENSATGADYQVEGQIGLRKIWNADTYLDMDAYFSASENRQSPGGSADFQTVLGEKKNLSLTVHGEFRLAEMTSPFAVTSAALKSGVGVAFSFRPHPRWILGMGYDFSQRSIVGGLDSQGHEGNAEVTWVILKKPYWTLTYHFTFGRESASAAFASLYPLITRQESHIVSTALSDQLTREISYSLYAYSGGDRERNLSIVNGDLWGAGGFLNWDPTPYWTIRFQYDYGRQSFASLTGDAMRVTVGILARGF